MVFHVNLHMQDGITAEACGDRGDWAGTKGPQNLHGHQEQCHSGGRGPRVGPWKQELPIAGPGTGCPWSHTAEALPPAPLEVRCSLPS